MKTNELRIGNKLLLNNKIITVLGVVNNRVYFGDENSPCYNYITEFKPIPLTDEIFLKNGFRIDGIYFIIKIDEFCNLCYNRTDKNIYIGVEYNAGGTELEFEYLHQLQNLYFVLTNQELKINI